MKCILGISAFYHDSAAALVIDGKIIAAVQEERFTRIKHDHSFPTNAIQFCIDYAKIDISSIEYIAFYDKPFLKFERILETHLSYAPKGIKSFIKALPLWVIIRLYLFCGFYIFSTNS
jgi:carbamoyltransferase